MLFSVGETYPDELPIVTDGGLFEIFRSDVTSSFLIAMHDISPAEHEAFSSDNPLQFGVYTDSAGSCICVFKFSSKGNQPFLMDCPLNVAAIPMDILDMERYDEPQARMAIAIIVVELNDRIVKHLRYVTLPPEATKQLLKTGRYQRTSCSAKSIFDSNMEVLEKNTGRQLSKLVRYYKCGT